MPERPSPSDAARISVEAQTAWSAVSAAFGALGRAFICADPQFRVIHGSYVLDRLIGAGAAKAVAGQALEALFGRELFGLGGTLRQALEAGERREGWRAQITVEGQEPRLVSLSAAPFPRDLDIACDPLVTFVVVLRPAEDDRESGAGAPTMLGNLIARSPAMLRVFALIDNLKHTDATILITGESGTGKELVAGAIHNLSPRRSGPFVAVNCGALPSDLLESEMFGHVRGAFTGAIRDRVGRFDLASNGTLFLDEVGDLPLPLQVKLLRVMQDGTYQRLGESQTRVSRARVIAATHVDLGQAVRTGRFRDDLYYRLRVVPIEIPPLRERPEDIEPIARLLLARVGARHGRALRFSPTTLRHLLAYAWPGNVRELENVLEYAVTVSRGQTLLPEDLPTLGEIRHNRHGDPGKGEPSLEPGEVDELRRILEACQWRRAEAAKALGISRVTLWRRMRGAGLIE